MVALSGFPVRIRAPTSHACPLRQEEIGSRLGTGTELNIKQREKITEDDFFDPADSFQLFPNPGGIASAVHNCVDEDFIAVDFVENSERKTPSQESMVIRVGLLMPSTVKAQRFNICVQID